MADRRRPLEKTPTVAMSATIPGRSPRTGVKSGGTSSFAVVNMFGEWYFALGFQGASSHSGRRTAITKWAGKISKVGGYLRDVQALAGHSALTTTQRYIECDG